MKASTFRIVFLAPMPLSLGGSLSDNTLARHENPALPKESRRDRSLLYEPVCIGILPRIEKRAKYVHDLRVSPYSAIAANCPKESVLNPDASEAVNRTRYEKNARRVDRLMTIAILMVLLAPLPFARFEACPTGSVISEHMIMPWSGFKICYTAFPSGEPVIESYRFTWKGEIIPREASNPVLFPIESITPPILKWQSLPDTQLKGLFFQGDMIRLKTFWQPIMLWPVKMVLQAGSQLSDYPGKRVQ
jgi:hypothetical protein